MAFKKIDKEYLVTDSSVNVYGFRLLTSGYLLDEFKKNPIGYHMHGDSKEFPRETGVLVRWEDFRTEGDCVYAKPVINLSHPRGQKTCDEIEDGFLNGASVGRIIALELSDDPVHMLPGQTGATVTKWYNRELSLVDMPGNFNSLSLYDNDGKEINLADIKSQSFNMKVITLTPELIKTLNLADNADQTAVTTLLNDLADKASKYDQMKPQYDTALADKKKAEDDLKALQASTAKQQVDDLLDAALSSKKITAKLKDTLATQYEGNPSGLKNLLDEMPAYQPVTEQIKKNGTGSNEDKFKNLSYSELDKAGLLPALKDSNIDLFKEKFKAEYGVEYKG